jgi:hypothetical protein
LSRRWTGATRNRKAAAELWLKALIQPTNIAFRYSNPAQYLGKEVAELIATNSPEMRIEVQNILKTKGFLEGRGDKFEDWKLGLATQKYVEANAAQLFK